MPNSKKQLIELFNKTLTNPQPVLRALPANHIFEEIEISQSSLTLYTGKLIKQGYLEKVEKSTWRIMKEIPADIKLYL